ncbi:hypothetical protein NA57DRAFT_78178 [Rhizodiscina lignyota]|uniref:Uncharacterized protein n=1 Tax=Rhizodiscina lignyota TaxID=1504668 RepID=A0A9P4IAP7_9PEZI|nr:hypothetical protein NA57DRAFT_78178 [Rhizodiscina lignyota]
MADPSYTKSAAEVSYSSLPATPLRDGEVSANAPTSGKDSDTVATKMSTTEDNAQLQSTNRALPSEAPGEPAKSEDSLKEHGDSIESSIDGDNPKKADNENGAKAPTVHLRHSRDTGIDSDSGTDDEETMHAASELTSSSLYEAYVEKLERENGPDPNHDKEMAPKLVKGFIDYVRTLERRVTILESGMGKGLPTGPPAPPTVKQKEVVPEVKFFNAANEVDPDGDFIPRKATEEDTYSSATADRCLIRVLYNWNTDEYDIGRVLSLDGKQQPEPEDIDIVAIGIESVHIWSFFSGHGGPWNL